MGILRTLLALAVVLVHAGSAFSPVPGWLAVEMFYVISGFLISMALLTNENYKASWRRFYENRALRIYPIYFAVLTVATFGYLVLPWIFGRPALFDAGLPLVTKVFLYISNLLLFTQDWTYLAALKDGHMAALGTPGASPFWLYFPVPQAWTLGVELSFYAVAPLLLLRRRVFLTALVIAVAVKVGSLLVLGWQDPWIYRFFPFELGMFLLGAASHQFLLPLYRSLRPSPVFDIAVTSATIALVGLLNFKILGLITGAWSGLLPCVALCAMLPSLFEFQNRWALDRSLGELSYPIYISHWTMMGVSSYFAGQLGITSPEAGAWIVAGASISAAILLNLCVGRPVEILRRSVRSTRPHPINSSTAAFRIVRAQLP